MYLNEHLAQEGHYKRRVHAAETADGADGQFTNLEHFIVQCHKQSLKVLCLCQVGIEPLVQRGQHAVTDIRICNRTYHKYKSHFETSIRQLV